AAHHELGWCNTFLRRQAELWQARRDHHQTRSRAVAARLPRRVRAAAKRCGHFCGVGGNRYLFAHERRRAIGCHFAVRTNEEYAYAVALSRGLHELGERIRFFTTRGEALEFAEDRRCRRRDPIEFVLALVVPLDEDECTARQQQRDANDRHKSENKFRLEAREDSHGSGLRAEPVARSPNRINLRPAAFEL